MKAAVLHVSEGMRERDAELNIAVRRDIEHPPP